MDKVPTIKLEHASCTISPDCWYNHRVVSKEQIRGIIWDMLRKKGDQHFGTVSMTKYNILLRFSGQQLIRN